jgi:hypothetical protein
MKSFAQTDFLYYKTIHSRPIETLFEKRSGPIAALMSEIIIKNFFSYGFRKYKLQICVTF